MPVAEKKAGLFVLVRGEWRWEGWLLMSPEEWARDHRDIFEQENSKGAYILVPMPSSIIIEAEAEKDTKTRVFVVSENKTTASVVSQLFQYEPEMDDDLVSDIMQDVGDWL